MEQPANHRCPELWSRHGDINVNGQRTSNNSISLEGINVNDFNLAHFDNRPLTNPTTLEEMKVSTSLYDASQGSKGGGRPRPGDQVRTEGLSLGRILVASQRRAQRERVFPQLKRRKQEARLLQNVFGGSGSGSSAKVGASGSLITRAFVLVMVWIRMLGPDTDDSEIHNCCGWNRDSRIVGCGFRAHARTDRSSRCELLN